jgi:hypothetical protein
MAKVCAKGKDKGQVQSQNRTKVRAGPRAESRA